ncbi:hypothetical protein [Halalkalibacter okhensis]|uniref:Zinc-finger domain-containing protein n=1 Tax=Halalkalibacter okhensis TaxID=333138 RepID=A0A0B0IDH7_9BACI|nr:hypothetical protein [Halalkalibacter okhensis]KHF38129.1 hypothetical protein LQ50_23225 [Halalkalibacter okhensis]
MNDYQKIHTLTRELIPVFDDLDQQSKEVILEHIESCRECKELYNDLINLDESYPKSEDKSDVGIRPLKKLVQFNRSLQWLFISIRAVVILFILFTAYNFYNWDLSLAAALEYIRSVTFMFYFPVATFLLVFTLIFFNKRWVVLSVIFDIFIILFLDTFISFLIK